MRLSHLSISLAVAFSTSFTVQAANHREAPITALDHKADITDVYAFRSYEAGLTEPKVTLIMAVDPLLEPANGPNWFPFDPDILYEIKVDNNNDAVEDIVFQFRFNTEQRLPGVFQTMVGVGNGANAAANSPAPVAPGTPIIPPQITSFESAGLGQLQRYSVTMVRVTPNTNQTRLQKRFPGRFDTQRVSTVLAQGGKASFEAVPANPGPRTMNYTMLFNAGIHTLDGGVKAFAGTTDDAFYIDLGGAFDTLNLHAGPVLTPEQDSAAMNIAPDTVSGYAVNHIAIEVPVSMLTRTGTVVAATDPAATIGVWATTSRPQTTVRRSPLASTSEGAWRQVQRMGNPLVNELLIGTGSKDRFSMDEPKNDSQFAEMLLDPLLPRVVNAALGVAIPTPPRTDLLPLVTYNAAITQNPNVPAGPVADLLRLNTGLPPTVDPEDRSRLGVIAGDVGGFPNGRRVFDDVTDIALRVVVGGVLNPTFTAEGGGFVPGVHDMLGDGVNVNDAAYKESFPYVAEAPSGRDRRHIDPGEAGCTGGSGPACPE